MRLHIVCNVDPTYVVCKLVCIVGRIDISASYWTQSKPYYSIVGWTYFYRGFLCPYFHVSTFDISNHHTSSSFSHRRMSRLSHTLRKLLQNELADDDGSHTKFCYANRPRCLDTRKLHHSQLRWYVATSFCHNHILFVVFQTRFGFDLASYRMSFVDTTSSDRVTCLTVSGDVMRSCLCVHNDMQPNSKFRNMNEYDIWSNVWYFSGISSNLQNRIW